MNPGRHEEEEAGNQGHRGAEAPALQAASLSIARMFEPYGIGFTLIVFATIRLVALAGAFTSPMDNPKLFWWSHVPTVRWDVGHYLHILEHGYPESLSDVTAFFPAFSLLAWPLTLILDPHWSLVVAAMLCSIAAAGFFYAWARRCGADAAAAFWAVMLLATFPPAMFFSTGYTEGLFILCVAAMLWLISHQRWLLAALVCGLSTATRPTGVAVAAALLIAAWGAGAVEKWSVTRRLARVALLGALSVSGIGLHELYLWQHYGRYDAYFTVQANWAFRPTSNPVRKALTLRPLIQGTLEPVKCGLQLGGRTWSDLLIPGRWNMPLNTLVVALAVVGLLRPGTIPRFAFLLPIFVFLMAYLDDPVQGSRLIGIARYQLVALAVFLWLAQWFQLRRTTPAMVGLCLLALAMQLNYIRRFANWEMVG
ncbi:MAG: glycosyltransferase family 39 protein [Phycisphaerae bacterium]